MDLINNLIFFYKIPWLWFVTLSFEPFGEILHKKQKVGWE
jgi:cytochrome c oxidase assembly factor CtaG